MKYLIISLLLIACGKEVPHDDGIPWNSPQKLLSDCKGEAYMLNGDISCPVSGLVCIIKTESGIYMNGTKLESDSCVYKMFN